jgi:hypothetical protein
MISLNDLLHLLSEAAIVALGSLLVYVSMRAYRRTKSRSMLALSLGFAVIIIEPLVEEILLDIFQFSMDEAHILRNWIVAVGLLVILYSIYRVRD